MKKIYINPGHSDKDPGAVGYETERRLNVAVSLFMNDYLLANYVCETRMNPGTMGSLTEICNDANKWGADLFVSNQFNAGGGDGYEALVYNQKRVELGKAFEKYVKEAGQNSIIILMLFSILPQKYIIPELCHLKTGALLSRKELHISEHLQPMNIYLMKLLLKVLTLLPLTD